MYTLEQLSMMTGLTTRTLRNYLKSGILCGSKDTGVWLFDEQQVQAFVGHPSAAPSIRTKQQAIVYDFLAGQEQMENEMCVMLDRSVQKKAAGKMADFLCQAAGQSSHIRFSYTWRAGKAHFILKGAEEEIHSILSEFYRQNF